MTPFAHILTLTAVFLCWNVKYTYQQVIQTQLKNATFLLGEHGFLNVKVRPDVTEDGVWSQNGRSLTRLRGKRLLLSTVETGARQLVIYNLAESDAGLYTFTIRQETTSAYLIVTRVPLEIRIGLQDIVVTEGGLIDLRTTLSQADIKRGTWTMGSRVLTSSSGPNINVRVEGYVQRLTISDAKTTDSGQYIFRVDGLITIAFVTVEPQGSAPINGGWSEWTQWVISTSCPATCETSAVGRRTRSRTCDSPRPQNGGLYCPGSQSETRPFECGSAPCPVNGVWAPWGQWGSLSCVETCGTLVIGSRMRGRTCTAAQNGGLPCSGPVSQNETVTCDSLPACPAPSVLATQLQNTTRSSGSQVLFTVTLTQAGLTGTWYKDGAQLSISDRIEITTQETVQILIISNLVPADTGLYLFAVNAETTSAYLTVTGRVPINGAWSNWGEWGDRTCPLLCGTQVTGRRTRTRTCTNPSPQFGGAFCAGSETDTESVECEATPCPGLISQGLQNNSYSIGEQIFLRITLSQTGLNGVWYKDGIQLYTGEKYDISNNGSTQLLTINDFQASDVGLYTFSVGGQSTSALVTVRQIHGGYTQWSGWLPIEACKQSCGTTESTTYRRTRACTAPAPAFGGRECIGPSVQTQIDSCNLPACPGNATVSKWGQWLDDACPVSCGTAHTTPSRRTRTCLEPGGQCNTTLSQSRLVKCGDRECPGDVLDYFTTNREVWLIGAIGASVGVGVLLIILIIVCCVWHCRKGNKEQSYTDRSSACELPVVPRNENDYVTRGKYLDQNISPSPDILK